RRDGQRGGAVLSLDPQYARRIEPQNGCLLGARKAARGHDGIDRVVLPGVGMVAAEPSMIWPAPTCAARWRSASGVNTSASKYSCFKYSVGRFFNATLGSQPDGLTKQA